MHFLHFFSKGHYLPWEVETQGKSHEFKSYFAIFLNLVWKTWTRTKNDFRIPFACLKFYLNFLFCSGPNSDRSLQIQYFLLSLLPLLLSTLVCCILWSASLVCFLNYQPVSHLKAPAFRYHNLVLGLQPRMSKTTLLLGVFSLCCYVFHLFLSHFGSSRYFSSVLASSFGK